MEFLTASVTALAVLAGASATASACDWMKNVTASAAPAQTGTATKAAATPVDPTLVAQLASAPATQPAAPADDQKKLEPAK
jgi:hypothetical protein